MQKILHLNSYLVDNSLYLNIYKELDSLYQQTIFVPLKEDRNFDNHTEFINGKIYCSKTIKSYHTFFYKHKIRTIYKKIKELGLINNTDFIHAHNLFVDGALAYLLKREFGMNYIVAIRMTDVDLQYKYMLHRRKFAKQILANASRIIFISPLYKDRLFSFISDKLRIDFNKKSSIIPNGIEAFWLKNKSDITPYREGMTYKILYIGQIQKRKNILKLIDAIEHLSNTRSIPIELTVVGKFHPNEPDYVKSFLSRIKNNQLVQYLGHVADRNEIQKLLKESHLMALPSTNELFGLVYIEAISQNTPVLYCEQEGISPFLENRPFAYSVKKHPLDKISISESIQKSIHNYSKLSEFSEFSIDFTWDKIVNEYRSLYESL